MKKKKIVLTVGIVFVICIIAVILLLVLFGNKEGKGDLVVEEVIVKETIAFEIPKIDSGDPSGIYAKELEGWTPVETVLYDTPVVEMKKGESIIRYWVYTSERMQDNISRLEELGYIDGTDTCVNSDGVKITCVVSKEKGKTLSYYFYKEIADDTYLNLTVYNSSGTLENDMSMEEYLLLTADDYYVYGD